MSPTLPLKPSLEHLRKQAKDLLKAHQHADPAVCPTLKRLRHLAQASDAEVLAAPLTLRQAQHALARDYGFAKWADLRAAVEKREAETMVTGGCFCGSVRYRIEDAAPKATICHCEGCRKASGAPVVAWITVRADALRLVQGELRTVRGGKVEHESCDGFGGTRSFCGQCGSQITFAGDGHADYIDITTGTLDDPNRFPPTEDSFAERKLVWIRRFA